MAILDPLFLLAQNAIHKSNRIKYDVKNSVKCRVKIGPYYLPLLFIILIMFGNNDILLIHEIFSKM